MMIVTPLAGAIPASTLQFSQTTLSGHQDLTTSAAAARIQSIDAMANARLAGFAESLVVRTENVEGPSVGVGLQPTRDGDTEPYTKAQLSASSTFTDLDLFIVPLADAEPPRITAKTSQTLIAASPETSVTEVGHVDASRQRYSADVRDLLAATGTTPAIIRIEGSFAISIWSWNFTVRTEGAEADYVTGAYQLEPIKDPVTGTNLAWRGYQQVAQLEVSDGWVELENLNAATLNTYAGEMHVNGLGDADIDGAVGLLGGQEARGARVSATGTYEMTATRSDTPALTLQRLVGDLRLDGAPINLGGSGALRDGSTVARQTGPTWPWILGIIGIILVAVLVKGPAQMGRFNRIQERFESKDYIGVLARIDPFTHRRRYRRKANFLKTVSLLSLEEFKEASLFLQTLGPAESPEPATKAFLQACAAAGLGQDDAVLQFLSACFRDDPSYIEEARTVPALAGYLPYFTLTSKEQAAT